MNKFTATIIPSRINRVALLGALITLSFGPTQTIQAAASAASSGATQETGIIEGRVQNEVSGLYLNNARIEVKGTTLRVYTDESGSYRLTNVPTGPVVLEALFTGLNPQEIPVTVTSGRAVRQDINLGAAGQTVVTMNAYEVAATKVMQQEMIAINEQRVAPNMKTVVAIGDLSENADGFLGEFLKYIPGISGTTALNIRGFPPEFTQVTINGAASADAQLQGTSRAVETQYAMSSENPCRARMSLAWR
jgi:iron complex outermembrane recepter protein